MVVSELYSSVLRLYLPKTNVNLCIFAPNFGLSESVLFTCTELPAPVCSARPAVEEEAAPHPVRLLNKATDSLTLIDTRPYLKEDPTESKRPLNSFGFCTRYYHFFFFSCGQFKDWLHFKMRINLKFSSLNNQTSKHKWHGPAISPSSF